MSEDYEDYDRATGELFDPSKIITSPSPGRHHLMPISALPGSFETAQVWSAIIKAQQTMKTPRRTKTANIKPRQGDTWQGFAYKYAPIEEITRVLKPALLENGLWYQQGLVYRGRQPFVRTMTYHTSGEWTACDYPVFSVGQDARSFAGGVTMAQRRGLMLAFGITPEDDNEERLEGASAEIREPRPHPRRTAPRREGASPRHAGAFSSGHVPEPPGEPADIDGVIADGWAFADKGAKALTGFCALLSDDQRKEIGSPTLDAWVRRAKQVEREHAE